MTTTMLNNNAHSSLTYVSGIRAFDKTISSCFNVCITLSPAASCCSDATQQMMILSDDDFDEVVRVDLQLIKQAWADMETGEKPFTPVVSKNQMKKIKRLARNL
jgi:hypothetical protein